MSAFRVSGEGFEGPWPFAKFQIRAKNCISSRHFFLFRVQPCFLMLIHIQQRFVLLSSIDQNPTCSIGCIFLHLRYLKNAANTQMLTHGVPNELPFPPVSCPRGKLLPLNNSHRKTWEIEIGPLFFRVILFQIGKNSLQTVKS